MNAHDSEAQLVETVIVSHPEIMSGTPVFAGTRVPVEAMIDYLKAGDTLDDFLDQFPSVSRERAIAALEQAEVAMNADETELHSQDPQHAIDGATSGQRTASVIQRDPQVLSGTPVFAGTRVPVRNLIDHLKQGDDLALFLEDFPSVTREQAIAALEELAQETIGPLHVHSAR